MNGYDGTTLAVLGALCLGPKTMGEIMNLLNQDLPEKSRKRLKYEQVEPALETLQRDGRVAYVNSRWAAIQGFVR
jgi:hypothetical protein